MQEDWDLCYEVMTMRRYAQLRETERSGGKVSIQESEWLHEIEDLAGVNTAPSAEEVRRMMR